MLTVALSRREALRLRVLQGRLPTFGRAVDFVPLSVLAPLSAPAADRAFIGNEIST
jgi:hypothetical protein